MDGDDAGAFSLQLQTAARDHARAPVARLWHGVDCLFPGARAARSEAARRPDSAAPSYAPKTEKIAFRDFIAQLPPDFRFAIEFRHPGWHRPHFIRLLEKHRICWVWSDMSPLNERNQAPFEFQPITTDFLYLRLLGDALTKYDGSGQRIHRSGKLLWKREAALDSWALRIQRHLDEIRSVWTFANNHYEGFSPETCQRLAQRLGFDLPLPFGETAASPNEPGQLDLFAETPPPERASIGLQRRSRAAASPGFESSRQAADSFPRAPRKAAARPCPSHSEYGRSDFSRPHP